MSTDCRFALVFVVAAACGCARVSSPLSGNLGGTGGSGAPDAAVGDDVDLGTPSSAGDLADATSPVDLARSAPDLTAPSSADLALPHDLATPPDLATAASCHLVVNEVQTGTTATLTEEFVEVFNPCASAIAVDNVKLVYRAANNTNPRSGADSATLFTFSGNLGAGAYLVLGGTGFTGAKDGALASGIAASGALGLRDAGGLLVDSVAFGSVAGNTFAETAAAPLPPTLASPGGSIERLANGVDTDDNSHDFQIAAKATPGAANH
ncbi:MAG: LigC protein [bacterium]|nr:LigC protein [bacterium]